MKPKCFNFDSYGILGKYWTCRFQFFFAKERKLLIRRLGLLEQDGTVSQSSSELDLNMVLVCPSASLKQQKQQMIHEIPHLNQCHSNKTPNFLNLITAIQPVPARDSSFNPEKHPTNNI